MESRYSMPVYERSFVGQEGPINCVDFSPDGTLLGMASSDKSIVIHRTQGRPYILEGHTGAVNYIRFSPAVLCRLLASGSQDGTVRIWMPSYHPASAAFRPHAAPVRCLDFSPDAQQIVTCSNDKSVKLWNVCHKKLVHCFSPLHAGWVESVKFSPDCGMRGLVVSGSKDRSIRLWDVRSGSIVSRPRGIQDGVRSVSFHPNGLSIAASESGSKVKIWDLRSASGPILTQQYGLHKNSVNSISFHPSGRYLISGSSDRTCMFMDLRQQVTFGYVRVHEGGVLTVCFSHSGLYLATAGVDGSCHLFRTTFDNKDYTDYRVIPQFPPYCLCERPQEVSESQRRSGQSAMHNRPGQRTRQNRAGQSIRRNRSRRQGGHYSFPECSTNDPNRTTSQRGQSSAGAVGSDTVPKSVCRLCLRGSLPLESAAEKCQSCGRDISHPFRLRDDVWECDRNSYQRVYNVNWTSQSPNSQQPRINFPIPMPFIGTEPAGLLINRAHRSSYNQILPGMYLRESLLQHGNDYRSIHQRLQQLNLVEDCDPLIIVSRHEPAAHGSGRVWSSNGRGTTQRRRAVSETGAKTSEDHPGRVAPGSSQGPSRTFQLVRSSTDPVISWRSSDKSKTLRWWDSDVASYPGNAAISSDGARPKSSAPLHSLAMHGAKGTEIISGAHFAGTSGRQVFQGARPKERKEAVDTQTFTHSGAKSAKNISRAKTGQAGKNKKQVDGGAMKKVRQQDVYDAQTGASSASGEKDDRKKGE